MPTVTFTTRGALRKSAMRQANELLALDAIRRNQPLSRTDLVRITGLSPSSVSFIVNRLARAGMVVEELVATHHQVGRRPTALRLAPDAVLAVGVHISPTESRVALADILGQVHSQKSIAWHANPEVFGSRVHAAIRAMLERARGKTVLGVGVALPGTIERTTGRVIAAENLQWYDVEAGRLLRGRLSLPFHYENSAKAAALAERFFAEPGSRPLQHFVVITPDDEGLGTGVITDGHLLQGAQCMGGEFGHIMLHPDGRLCPCGNRGCWEQYVSAPALARTYAELRGDGVDHENLLEAGAIVELALGGDATALNALRRSATDLGLGLINIVWALNPEAIIVGGYFARAWELVEDAVWEILKARAPRYILAGLRILPSRHAADPSLLGAFSLVFSHFFTRFEHDSPSSARPASVLMSAAV
jgi:predicted NBD/HSP70 family sugar kinase